ncbi:hypothetical protein Pcinc_028315 [Petrolisthes cinctipes]|uniref:Uncharacterized protein n=1 Tax=Petrolisthes cinctipes TaxID=88211 RepID=A0AAE1F369_PETCI|nr:hypothetical protein Pcinc_028315 [Petrolisthes cinctipes]
MLIHENPTKRNRRRALLVSGCGGDGGEGRKGKFGGQLHSTQPQGKLIKMTRNKPTSMWVGKLRKPVFLPSCLTPALGNICAREVNKRLLPSPLHLHCDWTGKGCRVPRPGRHTRTTTRLRETVKIE